MVMKKKKWFQILAPKIFDEKVIGETFASDPNTLTGRTVEVSLMELTNDISRFFLKLKFRINHVDGGKCFTEFYGSECTRERIYRMVQRRKKKIEAVQDVKTKDRVKVRIKVIIVTSRNVQTSVKDKIRNKSNNVIEKVINSWTVEEFVKNLIKGDIQKTIESECKKTYPIADVEIRKVEVLENKKVS